jgi:4-hydroxybenzoyl-CoA reductase beta subunit
MHLPAFRHLRAESLEDAAHALAKHGPGACLASGGTDLFPRLKQGLARPELVVSLRGIAPEAPSLSAGELRLDAQLPLASIVRSPEVRSAAPILAEAALSVGSNQIRHMATLGGNLCLESRCLYYNQSHSFQFVEPCLKRGGDGCYFAPGGRKCWAVFAADTVPALLCLEAKVRVVTPGGSRWLGLEALYTGDAARPLALGSNEVVAEVSVPAAAGRRAQAYRKFSRRKGLEFGGLTVAAVLELADGSACREARIAVGSASGGPLRARKAEAWLQGQDVSQGEVLRAAAAAVAAEIRPVAHHGYAAGFLRECLEVETRRVLAAAVEVEL